MIKIHITEVGDKVRQGRSSGAGLRQRSKSDVQVLGDRRGDERGSENMVLPDKPL